MTQLDLAAAVGMSQPSIARIERGTVLPRTGTVVAILDAVGCELRVEPRMEVRAELRRAASERLSRSIPRRTRDALGRARATTILRRLRAEAVPFVLLGDLAEVVHGAPRTLVRTLDICHSSGVAAARHLAGVLRDLGASPLPDVADLRDSAEVQVTTPAGDLRLITRTAAGDDYEQLARNASRLIIDTSLRVDVASLEDLVRVRRARAEIGDLEILAALQP